MPNGIQCIQYFSSTPFLWRKETVCQRNMSNKIFLNLLINRWVIVYAPRQSVRNSGFFQNPSNILRDPYIDHSWSKFEKFYTLGFSFILFLGLFLVFLIFCIIHRMIQIWIKNYKKNKTLKIFSSPYWNFLGS